MKKWKLGLTDKKSHSIGNTQARLAMLKHNPYMYLEYTSWQIQLYNYNILEETLIDIKRFFVIYSIFLGNRIFCRYALFNSLPLIYNRIFVSGQDAYFC